MARDEHRRWRPGALVVDGLVALLIVLGGMLATEHWLRSRRGWFQIRLIDLLIAPAVVAIPLVWWHGHVDQKRILGQAHQLRTQVESERFPPPLFQNFGCVNVSDVTPDWLRRLLGTTALTPWCTHTNRAYACVGLEGETAEQQWRFARRLRYTNLIRVEGPPTRSTLERLQEMACLDRLETVVLGFRDYYHNFDRATGEETRIEVGPEVTEPTDLRPLLKLPELEALSLMCPLIRVEHIEQLLASPEFAGSKLTTIHVNYMRVTEDELARLRALAGEQVAIHVPQGAIEKSL